MERLFYIPRRGFQMFYFKNEALIKNKEDNDI